MGIRHAIVSGTDSVGSRNRGATAEVIGQRMAKHAKWPVLGAAIAAGIMLAGFSQSALAANPTYAIVGPSEWNLPIVPSANVFIQTGIGQYSGSEYNVGGHKADIQGSHTYVGITRFAHLFSFQSMPKLGFFWEILVPTIFVQERGNSISGFGDPLFDFTVYGKPVTGLTIGFQNIVSLPFGSNELSNHYFEYQPSFIIDYNAAKFELDGTLGAGFASTQHLNGLNTDIGNTYFAEATASYHINASVSPFLAYNYQKNETSRDSDTGALAPGSAPVFGCVAPGGCHESSIGGGAKFNFTPNRWLDVWYLAGVSGQNTVRTNAVYLRFVDIL